MISWSRLLFLRSIEQLIHDVVLTTRWPSPGSTAPLPAGAVWMSGSPVITGTSWAIPSVSATSFRHGADHRARRSQRGQPRRIDTGTADQIGVEGEVIEIAEVDEEVGRHRRLGC